MRGASGFLLDTNVVSETRKARTDPNVASFLRDLDAASTYISVLTLGEIHRGILLKKRKSSDPEFAASLEAWSAGLEHLFADRILAVDVHIARLWGQWSADRSRPEIDTLLAATALAHDLTLVTRNLKDFSGIYLTIIDPWQAR